MREGKTEKKETKLKKWMMDCRDLKLKMSRSASKSNIELCNLLSQDS